jgi:hypothetical protein
VERPDLRGAFADLFDQHSLELRVLGVLFGVVA